MSNCIIWEGRTWSQGRYGCLYVNGKTVLAHRYAWENVNGKIPDGLIVCHKCDNGLCINPNHLFIGTHKDNMQDCSRKGRLNTARQDGIYNNNAKPHLIEKYKDIKQDRANGYTYSMLKIKYGIKSNGHLRNILVK